MTEDFILIAIVNLVWAALAALYAFVPMFTMPGSAFVWGSGAVVFFLPRVHGCRHRKAADVMLNLCL